MTLDQIDRNGFAASYALNIVNAFTAELVDVIGGTTPEDITLDQAKRGISTMATMLFEATTLLRDVLTELAVKHAAVKAEVEQLSAMLDEQDNPPDEG